MIANGNASLHNLVMIALDMLGSQYNYKGLRLALIAILDMVLLFIFGLFILYEFDVKKASQSWRIIPTRLSLNKRKRITTNSRYNCHSIL